MLDSLKNSLKEILGFDFEFSQIPDRAMGDLAIACFDEAKKRKTNPNEIAKNIAEKIQNSSLEIIEKTEAVGSYVNLTLKTGELAKNILTQKIEVEKVGQGKNILIEYPSQNTHKEFHIGHLRIASLGNALVGLYQKTGHKVIPINYINDFGSAVSKCLWGILNLGETEPAEDKQKWLGQIYAKANIYLDDHPEKKEEVDEIQAKVESKDGEIYDLFLKTRQWSLDGFNKLQDELGVKPEKTFYESDIKDDGQKMVDELLEKGIAEKGDGGAIIVDLEKENLGVALLRKSNGAGVYMTGDLSLAKTKKEIYPDIDESINFTGIEQNFYFQQLFKILELAGFEYKMFHIGCGLVVLPTGKMSSRKGNVILYEGVRDALVEEFIKQTSERHGDWSEEQIKNVVHSLALASMKFSMQKHEAGKKIVFDTKEESRVDGYNAPYVLYVVARINSILREVDSMGTETFDSLKEKEEKELLLFLAQYEDAVLKAWKDRNPSTITRYCFDLAQTFNDFYAKHKIIVEDKNLRSARISLCEKTKSVLEDALGILTIDTLERM